MPRPGLDRPTLALQGKKKCLCPISVKIRRTLNIVKSTSAILGRASGQMELIKRLINPYFPTALSLLPSSFVSLRGLSGRLEPWSANQTAMHQLLPLHKFSGLQFVWVLPKLEKTTPLVWRQERGACHLVRYSTDSNPFLPA